MLLYFHQQNSEVIAQETIWYKQDIIPVYIRHQQ